MNDEEKVGEWEEGGEVTGKGRKEVGKVINRTWSKTG